MRKEHWLIVSVFVVIALWMLTPSLVDLFAPTVEDAIAERGQFGDMYGFITSLFSGLTIIGLIYTIIQQREDLRIARESLVEQRREIILNREAIDLARNEMELSKKAIEQSAKELKAQNKLQKYQRFDNTFFNLLELNLSILVEIKNYAFESFFTNAEDSIVEGRFRDEIRNLYRVGLHDSVKQKLSPFASSMFYFLQWICKEKGEAGMKKYLPLVFSQFNKKEKQFLFYYFNLDTPHPNIKEFDDYLIPFPRDEKIHNAAKLFDEW